MTDDLKKYTDLKIDEIKLKAVRGFSDFFSRLSTCFVILIVGVMFLGLLSYALLRWLDTLIGEPWGTLCVAGLLLILLVILIACRKSLFRDRYVRLFIDIFYGNEKLED